MGNGKNDITRSGKGRVSPGDRNDVVKNPWESEGSTTGAQGKGLGIKPGFDGQGSLNPGIDFAGLKGGGGVLSALEAQIQQKADEITATDAEKQLSQGDFTNPFNDAGGHLRNSQAGVQVGSYSGKVIGNVPIFAPNMGQGIGNSTARETALNQAAQKAAADKEKNAAARRKGAVLVGDRTQFNDAEYNKIHAQNTANGINAIVGRAQMEHGADWLDYTQNEVDPDGGVSKYYQELEAFRRKQDTVATVGNEVMTEALAVQENKRAYTPETIQMSKDLLSGIGPYSEMSPESLLELKETFNGSVLASDYLVSSKLNNTLKAVVNKKYEEASISGSKGLHYTKISEVPPEVIKAVKNQMKIGLNYQAAGFSPEEENKMIDDAIAAYLTTASEESYQQLQSQSSQLTSGEKKQIANENNIVERIGTFNADRAVKTVTEERKARVNQENKEFSDNVTEIRSNSSLSVSVKEGRVRKLAENHEYMLDVIKDEYDMSEEFAKTKVASSSASINHGAVTTQAIPDQTVINYKTGEAINQDEPYTIKLSNTGSYAVAAKDITTSGGAIIKKGSILNDDEIKKYEGKAEYKVMTMGRAEIINPEYVDPSLLSSRGKTKQNKAGIKPKMWVPVYGQASDFKNSLVDDADIPMDTPNGLNVRNAANQEAYLKGDTSYTTEQEKAIKENMAANPEYTREEIINALGYE